ncbi:hypothetical protein [Piscirickettsia salmonis]|uniref:hypothetical protein n=1 Tax=Piscirickettsia salmonis TaxID=1238 RepID=UPI0006BD4D97|nr:hypothetical protein [Piscirickettsia salmonis]ALA26682.1 hypothetical protein KW89_3p56 [Piscirickettsia salmonis]APS45893.1 hypothetical protein AVI48_15800 [Piscirickettsia salmonis]APS49224.1 hypothetical protein AVI49_16325 [Piscirickettsia salmonis]QGO82298.1 hypothetical protein Psal107_03349 [Piscirickettsia salmonis]QGP24127.1 hypothetical protein Psal158_03301 [Piscirickettsia salmonis]
MSFVIIWDTCTKPDYYQDLHNVLASPKETIVRYEYKTYLFDKKSKLEFEKLSKNIVSSIDIIIVYGEQTDESSVFDNGKQKVNEFIPYRLGQVIACKITNNSDNNKKSKIIYDIKLLDYPNLDKFDRKLFIKNIENNIPYESWHSYVENIEAEDIFQKDRVKTIGKLELIKNKIKAFISKNGLLQSDEAKTTDRWEVIVDRLNNLRFKNDSFWRLEVFKDFHQNKPCDVDLEKHGLRSTVSYLKVKDEKYIYFGVQYKSGHDTSAETRNIEIEQPNNMISSARSIKIRPYSYANFQVKMTTNYHLHGEHGVLYLSTSSDTASSRKNPYGPNLKIDIVISKSKIKTFIGIFLGIISVPGLLLASKIPVYIKNTHGVETISLYALSTSIALLATFSLTFFISGVLLRKEYKIR